MPLKEEPLYSTPDEFLDAITQKINVLGKYYSIILH